MMLNENEPTKKLDEDILQCKMDLRNALAATRKMSKDIAVPKNDSVQSLQPVQSIQSVPDLDKDDAVFVEIASSAPDSDVRILSFEDIHKKQDSKKPESSDYSTQADAISMEMDALRQTIRRLEQTIEDERQKSSQLEQLAEQLRYSIADREADIRLVRNDLDRRNEQFDDAQRRLDNSAHTIEQQRLRIDELEKELAEKIGELSVLRQQADEAAAALARQAETLHRAGQEKEVAEKRLESQAAELAKTIELLKEAQQSAAQTLLQRQAELDHLRETLAEMESRLNRAESKNEALLREKMELTALLHDAQQQLEQQESAVRQAFSLEDADDVEQTPEPYCEPVAEEICEDDVHLEQKLSDNAIPTFNLAEQIMAEQRKASAERRKGPHSGSVADPADKKGIEQVMRQYIADVPLVSASLSSAKQQTDRFARWQGETLSGLQQSLLAAIVQKDIRQYCGTDSPDYGTHPAAYRRPMSN